MARLLEALDRHGAQYIVVGGAGARGHGATRDTVDLDCVVRQDRENLDNVAAALRDLGAFLRVGGMSDEEARRLPVQVDARTLEGFTTWRTLAGDVDIIADIPRREGGRIGYEELARHALVVNVKDYGRRLVIAALDDIIASKEGADRPKDREALPELYALRDRQLGATGTAPEAGGPPSGPVQEGREEDRNEN